MDSTHRQVLGITVLTTTLATSLAVLFFPKQLSGQGHGLLLMALPQFGLDLAILTFLLG